MSVSLVYNLHFPWGHFCSTAIQLYKSACGKPRAHVHLCHKFVFVKRRLFVNHRFFGILFGIINSSVLVFRSLIFEILWDLLSNSFTVLQVFLILSELLYSCSRKVSLQFCRLSIRTVVFMMFIYPWCPLVPFLCFFMCACLSKFIVKLHFVTSQDLFGLSYWSKLRSEKVAKSI